jgi:hypothetical protein
VRGWCIRVPNHRSFKQLQTAQEWRRERLPSRTDASLGTVAESGTFGSSGGVAAPIAPFSGSSTYCFLARMSTHVFVSSPAPFFGYLAFVTQPIPFR